MKKSLFGLWSKGYLYFITAGILSLIFLLDTRIGIYDWGKEIAYFNFIKTSLTQYHSLPLFWWNSQGYGAYPAISVSSFFLANPETYALSPFIFLLYWMDTLVFMKLLAGLFCGLGILGILKLGQKLQWKPNQQRIFAALFLFSPIVVQHLAIGYFPWLNIYLFPWLLFFLIEEKTIMAVLGAAAVLALVLLQGGLHPFVWFSIFLGIFYLVHFLQKPAFKTILTVIAILALTILLSFVRLSTSMQTFADFQQRFFNGYSLSGFVRWSLSPPIFTPADMDDIEPYIESYDNGVPYWDGAIYWGGVLPMAFIALPILVNKRFSKSPVGTVKFQTEIFAIGISALVMTILSFGNLYQTLIVPVSDFLKLPALQGMEKYPFRFAIPGYFGFAFLIACSYSDVVFCLQQFLTFLNSFCAKINELVLGFSRTKWLKVFQVFVFLFSALFIFALLLRNPFLSWLEPVIRSAYGEKAFPWLTKLMSRRSFIPVTAYIEKAKNLYASLQVWCLRLSIFGWVILLQIQFNQPIKSFFNKISQILKTKMAFFLEIILVVPLLFASVMWLRVALATPLKNWKQLSLLPPEMETIPSGTLSSIDYSISPSWLKLNRQTNHPLYAVIFTNLKFSDRTFLETNGAGDRWLNQNGSLGLIPAGSGEIKIQVRPEKYQPALWITVIAWLAVFTAGIIYHRKKSSHPVSKFTINAAHKTKY